MKFFEDIQVGDVFDFGRHTFTAETSRPSPRASIRSAFHVDEAAAERSHFGALVASGWHTALAWMRLMIDYRRRMDEAMLARGEPVAGIGPALGFRDLKWPKPVYVGDTIAYRSEVIELRLSNSRPQLRADDVPLDRRQPARQAGALARSAPPSSSGARNRHDRRGRDHAIAKRGTARARRRLRRACAARRLHRPHLRHAADLAARIRPRLCRARADEDGVLRHAGGLSDSRPAFSPNGSARRSCWRSAPRSPASAIASPA